MPCPFMFIGAVLVGKPEWSPVYWIIKMKDGDFSHIKENSGSLVFSTVISIAGWKIYKFLRYKYLLANSPEAKNQQVNRDGCSNSACPVERFLPSFLFIKPKGTEHAPGAAPPPVSGGCPLGFGRGAAAAPPPPAAGAGATSGGCPLGFGRGAAPAGPGGSAAAAEELPELPLFVLYAHKELVSVQGDLYDLSAGERAAGGWAPFPRADPKLKPFRGHDISYNLATDSTSHTTLDKGLQGLGYEELRRLAGWAAEFRARLPRVGRLAAADYEKMFGHPRDRDPNAEFGGAVAAAAAAQGGQGGGSGAALHRAIEAGDAAAVRSCLESDSTVLNAICSRTQLSPLHKAVENGHLNIVEILAEAGADLSCKASLYDDDTPLKLAQRLRQVKIMQYLQARSPAS